MRYRNAQDVFPKDVLELIYEFIDGEYIYIPRKEINRKEWGENTQSKAKTKRRNEKIYTQYKLGKKISEIAIEYFLSEKSIQRIVMQMKKADLK